MYQRLGKPPPVVLIICKVWEPGVPTPLEKHRARISHFLGLTVFVIKKKKELICLFCKRPEFSQGRFYPHSGLFILLVGKPGCPETIGEGASFTSLPTFLTSVKYFLRVLLGPFKC